MTMTGGQFMFRKSSDEDITEEEYEKYIGPHRELTEKFLEEFIMPEYIAFYIASGFNHHALWEGTFSQHYNSAADLFNYFPDDKTLVIDNVKKILRIKYSLEVVEEKPYLQLKRLDLRDTLLEEQN